MLIVSSRLGPYEIVAPLGAGGMGEVYRARDTRLEREVAVKVLRERFTDDPGLLARFEREAKAVAALSHPNILAIHDYGTHEGITYAVMELLEGETIRKRLSKGALPWREAVTVGAAVTAGLAAAHAKGIIHRDLKPENLFLTADGRVKILDFGLARMAPLPHTQVETAPYVPAETETGMVVGTVGYMSPEQVRAQPLDARSDLFALGCVLYEMVSRRRPFARETAAETQTAILRDEPPDLAASGIIVPVELERLIRHCLEKSVELRCQTAHELAAALHAVQSETDGGLARPPLRSKAAGHRSRKPIDALAILPLVNAIGALMVIWTGVWYVYLLNNPPETHRVYYWCTGFLVTGLTMVLFGLVLGRLGRSARVAELTCSPPPAPSPFPLVVVNPSANAVAAPVATPGNPVAVVIGQDGRVVLPSPQGNGLLQASGVRNQKSTDP